MSKIRLQPLRIPPGWEIKWSNFFENGESDDVSEVELSESSIFHALYHLRDFGKVGIDLGWSSINNSGGNYILHIVFWEEIKFSQNPKQRIFIKKEDYELEYLFQPSVKAAKSNWENPLLISSDRRKIVEKIEEVFQDVSSYLNHPHWKKSFFEKYKSLFSE